MKNSALPFVLILLAACNMGNSSSKKTEKKAFPVVAPTVSQEDTLNYRSIGHEASSIDFNLTKTFSTPNLILNFPDAQNLGWIRISGVDAETLANSLRVKEETVEEVRQKEGNNIICQTRAERVTCSLFFDYTKGEIGERREKVLKDNSVTLLKEDYAGENLEIDASSKKATIILKGADARAVFYTLNETVDIDSSHDAKSREIKKADDISCTKTIDEELDSRESAEYECKVDLNFTNGKIRGKSFLGL